MTTQRRPSGRSILLEKVRASMKLHGSAATEVVQHQAAANSNILTRWAVNQRRRGFDLLPAQGCDCPLQSGEEMWRR